MAELKRKEGAERRGFKLTDYFHVLATVFFLIFFTIFNPNFLGIMNLKNLLNDIAPLLVMCCGVTFVLLIGSIDLSIGAICSTSAVILVLLLPKIGGIAYLIVVIFGVAAGFINGIIFSKSKIPSFIATLGMMGVWKSIALIMSGGAPLQILREDWGYISWAKTSLSIFGIPLFVAIAILLIFFVIQRYTRMGKFSYAVGANERAARIAGVNVDMTKIGVFMMSGACSAMAGAFLSAKLRSGIPTVGEPLTLLAIVAVALGGTALSGGKGGVIGTLLGVLMVIIIQNGMNIIGVDAFWQQIVFGAMVILAVYITVDRSGRKFIVK